MEQGEEHASRRPHVRTGRLHLLLNDLGRAEVATVRVRVRVGVRVRVRVRVRARLRVRVRVTLMERKEQST